jgi:hypothetical protein
MPVNRPQEKPDAMDDAENRAPDSNLDPKRPFACVHARPIPSKSGTKKQLSKAGTGHSAGASSVKISHHGGTAARILNKPFPSTGKTPANARLIPSTFGTAPAHTGSPLLPLQPSVQRQQPSATPAMKESGANEKIVVLDSDDDQSPASFITDRAELMATIERRKKRRASQGAR